MYRITNEEDIPYILKYHRAKDMVNILKYFPNLSPIDDLAVITDVDDYLKNNCAFNCRYFVLKKYVQK